MRKEHYRILCGSGVLSLAPPALAKDAITEEEVLVHYRRVRDEIRAYVEEMPDALGSA